MPSKRMVPILFSLASSMLVVLALAGCGGSGSLQTTPIPQSQANKLVFVQTASLTDKEVAQLPAGFVEKAAETGWRRVPGGFEIELAGGDIQVTDGVFTTTTAQDGSFTLPDADSDTLWMVFPEAQVELPAREKSASSTTGLIKVVTSYGSCCASCTDGCCTTDDNEDNHDHVDHGASDAMDDVRCLDYNGWYTDGKNYPKNDWRAYRNFLGSDCHMALGWCLTDHFRGGCYAVHGSNCSKKIGHPQTYHRH